MSERPMPERADGGPARPTLLAKRDVDPASEPVLLVPLALAVPGATRGTRAALQIHGGAPTEA
jgi:hypothetical protein